MLEITLTIITFIALITASYTDLKTREVPDWLSYGLLFSALGIRLIFSLEQGWSIILSGLLGFAILFSIGYVFYRVSQWGGGDAKLLMGMGAVIGVTVPFSQSSLSLLWYFLALLLIGAVYGLIWIFYLAIKSKGEVRLSFVKMAQKQKLTHMTLLILTVFLIILSILNSLIWPLVVFPLAIFYLFVLISVVEKTSFLRKVSPAKLTEGDWMVEDLKMKGKLVLEKKTLETADILKLRKLSQEGKLEKVLIKDGIPFIPSFLFAYLLFVFGSKVWEWVMGRVLG